jgi:hypothetical protein
VVDFSEEKAFSSIPVKELLTKRKPAGLVHGQFGEAEGGFSLIGSRLPCPMGGDIGNCHRQFGRDIWEQPAENRPAPPAGEHPVSADVLQEGGSPSIDQGLKVLFQTLLGTKRNPSMATTTASTSCWNMTASA